MVRIYFKMYKVALKIFIKLISNSFQVYKNNLKKSETSFDNSRYITVFG